MTHFQGEIEWDDDANAPSSMAILTLPDGTKHTILRESQSSMVQVSNGPLFYGSTKYYLVVDNQKTEFSSFNALMIQGLGQKYISDPDNIYDKPQL